LSNKVREMHSYILAKYGDSLPLNYGIESQGDQYRKYIKADSGLSVQPIHADDHSYTEKLVAKFAQAIELYRQS